MNKMKKKIQSIYDYNFAQLMLIGYLLCVLFYPAASHKIHQYNMFLIVPHIFLVGFILLEILHKGKSLLSKSNKYLYVFTIYVVLFMVYNLFFYAKYNALINKSIAFLFIYILFDHYMDSNEKFDFVLKWLVNVFTLAILFSVYLYFVRGYDRIIIGINHIRIVSLGEIYENRLTYIFKHKSEYGLMLNALLIVCLRYRNIQFRYVRVLLILFTLVLVNSVASMGGAIVIVIAYWLNYEVKKNGWKSFKIIAAIAVLVIGAIAFFFYVSSVRNINTLGSRIPIWKSGLRCLLESPMGLDEKFFSEQRNFVFDSAGNTINTSNFHNIFFNEAAMYSIPVAIAYFVLFFWRFGIKINTNKTLVDFVFLIGLLCTMCFDQSVSDASLALLLMLMGFGFSNNVRRSNAIE